MRSASISMPEELEPGERAARAAAALFSPTPAVNDDDVEPAELREVGADVVRGGGARRLEREPAPHRRRSTPPPARRACRRCRSGPSRPLRLLSRSSSSSIDSPAARCRWTSTAGSRSPERVPITRPSSGVSPIEVSTERPPSIARRRRAVAEVQHDLLQLGERPAEEARRPAPRRTCARCRGIRSGGRRCFAASSRVDRVGVRRRRQRLVERGVEDGDVRHVGQRLLRGRGCPSRFAGLCSGASADELVDADLDLRRR